MRKASFNVLLCLAGIMVNILFSYPFRKYIPLYLDTIGTIAVTFAGGLFWGALTGGLHNLIFAIIFTLIFDQWSWGNYLFALCNIATAVLTSAFVRLFPRELSLRAETPPGVSLSLDMIGFINRGVILLLLSFALCLLMSVMGGVISALTQLYNGLGMNGLQDAMVSMLLPARYPLILREILSRIPINLVDRPISVFAGYLFALGAKKAAGTLLRNRREVKMGIAK